MYRVVATVLAAALSAPPAGTEEEEAPATDAATEDADASDDADAAPEETSGLPSVEDPPEKAAPPPPVEPEPPATTAPAPKPEGPVAVPAPMPPAGRDRLGCDFSKSCRQLTITGTVLGALGLVAIGTGVALFVRDDEVIADEPAYAKSTKPPGLVALTLGSGVVVTSILMLFASHRGGKEARAEAAVARKLLRPLAAGGGRF